MLEREASEAVMQESLVLELAAANPTGMMRLI